MLHVCPKKVISSHYWIQISKYNYKECICRLIATIIYEELGVKKLSVLNCELLIRLIVQVEDPEK